MTLDLLVKISKIATPFIILFVGFWLNRSVQKHSLNMKLTSEFNTKWSNEFISISKNFSEKISEFQHVIFHMTEEGGQSESVRKRSTEKYNELLPTIGRAKYDIEVHSTLIDNSEKIIETINEIFNKSTNNAEAVKNGGHVDFDTIKILQLKLNGQLKNMQKSVLKL